MATRAHDFPEDSPGKAITYGVYDLTGNTGWVNVGTYHDTAAFAFESIAVACLRPSYLAPRRTQ